MNFSFQILSLSLALFVAIGARAQSPPRLSNENFYTRCYLHLVREQPAPNDANLVAVIAGTMNPVSACMNLLDEAKFDGTGKTTNLRGQKVLKTINDFHRGWFDVKDFKSSLPLENDNMFPGTPLHYDSGEAAYHLTRALFRPSTNVSEAVTSPISYEAIRVDPNSNTELGRDPTRIAVKFGYQIFSGAVQEWLTPNILAPQGKLIGVRDLQTSILPGVGSGSKLTNISTRTSNGGGIIGTVPFMMLNWGRLFEQKSDGGIKVPRRWARAVFNSLLCRDLPLLRTSDAVLQTAPTPSSGTPSFRTGTSCMRCHQTMDPFAYTGRNSVLVWATAGIYQPQISTAFMAKHTPDLGSESSSAFVDGDSDFHRRPPIGKLTYRSFDGKLVDVGVTSIQDLGTQLSKEKDFYACVAKRYVEFFTGISANLQDEGDPDNAPLTASSIEMRNRVIKMGDDLQKSGSIRSLVQDIFASPMYVDSKYGIR